ncbi:kinase-like domain-containing protein [Xylaria cubensis]|nr:kinase-like domain-containing protein [Xylaria cubensis]
MRLKTGSHPILQWPSSPRFTCWSIDAAKHIEKPHIVKLLDPDPGPPPSLNFEYIPHSSIKDHTSRGKYFTEIECLQILRQIASAVAYLHKRNITHRDISHGNILVQHRDADKIECLDPTDITCTMASSSTPVSGSKQTQTSSTSGMGTSRRSTAYDKNFAQICIDHRIYPQDHVSRDDGFTLEPANLDEICRALKSSKSSPPPETDFKVFQKINVSPLTESTVMDTLVPLLTGLNTDILKPSNLLFNNLTSLTDNLTVAIKSDFCDGACPEDVDLEIR